MNFKIYKFYVFFIIYYIFKLKFYLFINICLKLFNKNFYKLKNIIIIYNSKIIKSIYFLIIFFTFAITSH